MRTCESNSNLFQEFIEANNEVVCITIHHLLEFLENSFKNIESWGKGTVRTPNKIIQVNYI